MSHWTRRVCLMALIYPLALIEIGCVAPVEELDESMEERAGEALAPASANAAGEAAASGAVGQVAFFDGPSSLTGDSGLFWDNTNKRLGVGTNAPSVMLDVTGGEARFRNRYASNAYFEFIGIHGDGRQRLVHKNVDGEVQILAARGGFGGGPAATLGPPGGPRAVSTPGGLTGRIVFGPADTAIGGFAVGGYASNTGTVPSHQSLYIGTPESSPTYNYGIGNYVDLGTFSSAGNTWGGVRPKLRYTAQEHELRVDSSTGQNNPGQTVLKVTQTEGVGTVRVSSVLRLQPTDSPPSCAATSEGSVYYSASLKTLCLCNGTSWNQLAGGGAC